MHVGRLGGDAALGYGTGKRFNRVRLRARDSLHLYRDGVLLVIHRDPDKICLEVNPARLRLRRDWIKRTYHYVRHQGFWPQDQLKTSTPEIEQIRGEIQSNLPKDLSLL